MKLLSDCSRGVNTPFNITYQSCVATYCARNPPQEGSSKNYMHLSKKRLLPIFSLPCNHACMTQGWGTVRFESPEEAEKAIEVMNNSDLEGRRLGVKLDKFA